MKVVVHESFKSENARSGFEATGIKHWKVLATAAGALFIRSYERGERVHLSMLSRGYVGVLPHEEQPHVKSSVWFTALMYPFIAAIIFTAQLVIGKM